MQYFIKATVTEIGETCIHIKGVNEMLFEDQKDEDLWNIYEPTEQKEKKADWSPIIRKSDAEISLCNLGQTMQQSILSAAFIQGIALTFTVEIKEEENKKEKISLVSIAYDKE